MGLEAGTFIDDLVITNPVGATDERRFGDDHLRLIKSVLKNTFPDATRALRHLRVEDRSSNTILELEDAGLMINVTTEFTQTFDTAVALGDGWWVRIRNASTGIHLLGTNAIDGIGPPYPMFPGEEFMVVCDGTAFYTVGARQKTLVGSGTAASSASIQFTGIGANMARFRTFEFEFESVRPATDGAHLFFQMSSDNGSNYTASGYPWVRTVGTTPSTASGGGSTSDTQVSLYPDQGNGTLEMVHGTAKIFGATHPHMHWSLGGVVSSGEYGVVHGFARFSLYNAVKFYYSTGNISTGTIRCFGQA